MSRLLAHDAAGPVTVVDAHPTGRLRRLYLVRAAFAIAWAGAFAVSASTLDALSVMLLVLYPAFDLAAAVVDHRSSPATRRRRPLLLNMALSLLATAGLAAAATSGAPTVLRVWGAWALTTGFVQLVVAVPRRRLGGQWPLIASGALSTLAGVGFVLAAAGTEPSLTGLAGYAALGGVFFLTSALRLHRSSPTSDDQRGQPTW